MILRAALLGIGWALCVMGLLALWQHDRGPPTLADYQRAGVARFGLRYTSSGMTDGAKSGVKFCQVQGSISPPVFCVTEQ